MLSLDCRISSDELNRAIFTVTDEDDLGEAIERIRHARTVGNPSILGDEVISGTSKNDRIIPWMSLASFGWTLFSDKRAATASNYYEIPASTHHILSQAARITHRHRSFSNVEEYVTHISRAAALPMDLR